MKTAYFVSGLGADHRLFKKQLQENIPLVILPWLVPQQNETLESYAQRMALQIPEKGKSVIIGGVSFGGIMAIEMSAFLSVEKIILISSVKSSSEIPWHIRIGKFLPIYKIAGGNNLKRAGFIFRYLFGRMPSEEKSTFLQMVKDSNPEFITWAIDKICHWKNKDQFLPFTHIHGTSDLIFPVSRIKQPLIKIHKGTHLMIMTSYKRINELLKIELTD